MLTKNPTAAIMSAMPEGCEASAAQTSGFKTDSEQKLKLDSKQSKCGWKKCRDLGFCFAHRKKSHESGQYLYCLIKCKTKEKKKPKKDSKAAGTAKEPPPTTTNMVTIPTGQFGLINSPTPQPITPAMLASLAPGADNGQKFTDGPSNKLGRNDEKDWVRVFGCGLGQSCPRGFCIHIQGVAGLDVEYVMRLLKELNTRTELNLGLEDILDIKVPKFMKLMSNGGVLATARLGQAACLTVRRSIKSSDSSDTDTGFSENEVPPPHRARTP